MCMPFENILSGGFHSNLPYNLLKKKQPAAFRKCFLQLHLCWGGQLVCCFWFYPHLAAPQPFDNNSVSTSTTSLMQEEF